MSDRMNYDDLIDKGYLISSHGDEFCNGLLRVNSGGYYSDDKWEPYEEWMDYIERISGGKWGFINEAEEECIPCIYDYAHPFKDDFATVKLNGKWGGINTKGEEIIPIIYDNCIWHLWYLKNKVAIVQREGKFGLIDKKGKELIDCIYDEIRSIPDSNDTLAVRFGNLWGISNISGKLIIPTSYEFINTWISSSHHSESYPYSEEIICAKKDNKYGFLYIRGELAFKEFIPCIYDNFYEGHKFEFKEKDKVCQSYPFLFTEKEKITVYNIIKSEWKNNYGYEYNAFISLSFSYNRIIETNNRRDFIFEYQNKKGLLNGRFELIIPCIYDEIVNGNDYKIVAIEKRDEENYPINKYGLIDRNGIVILPPMYDSIKEDYSSSEYRINKVYEVHKDNRKSLFYPDTTTFLPISSYSKGTLFIDIETNGLPVNARNLDYTNLNNWPYIIEIGIILMQGTYEKENFHFNVSKRESFILRPEHKFIISSESESIHGISQEKAESEGFSRKNVLNYIWNLINQTEYIVCHNMDFDLNVLKCEFIRNNLAYSSKQIDSHFAHIKREICTMKETVDFCAIKNNNGYKWPTLEELYKKLFEKELPDKHRADKDVYATCKCFSELLKRGIIKLSFI